MADVERLLGASHPSEVLALRESFSNGLDASLAITALEAIAASAERTAVERDLRFAQLLFELNQVAHGRDLPPRLVLRMLRALARLGLKQPAMFFCLGAMAAKRIQDFAGPELVSLLRSFAQANVKDLQLLEALTTALCPQLHLCCPGELAEVARDLRFFRFRPSKMCLAALHGESKAKLKAFQAAGLCDVLWCLDSFGEHEMCADLIESTTIFPDQPILLATACALSETACATPGRERHLDEILQPLLTALRRGTSFNVPVPHLGPHHTKRLLKALGVQATCDRRWAAAARRAVRAVAESSPSPAAPRAKSGCDHTYVVDPSSYAEVVTRFGVDNFGKIGGRCLLNQIGIGRLEERWAAEVREFLTAWQGVANSSMDWKAPAAHRRIYAFAEFHFTSRMEPGRILLEGTLFQLNGLWGDPVQARKPWLYAGA
ncbi:unnamed protein product [Durusdinium trenchii]|uniref:Uncharacterized protein n=1 Tax=Durusdinium trenchii TaxID=1381693 RepID=A0ABP0RAL7_9DINO